MKVFLIFLLSFSMQCSSLMSSAGIDSVHMICKFWQQENGKYCIQVIPTDEEILSLRKPYAPPPPDSPKGANGPCQPGSC